MSVPDIPYSTQVPMSTFNTSSAQAWASAADNSFLLPLPVVQVMWLMDGNVIHGLKQVKAVTLELAVLNVMD